MYDGPYQEKKFLNMKKEAGLDEDSMVLRKRWLAADQHWGITLSNRAGTVNLSKVSLPPLTEALKEKCFYPFYQTMVDYDGTVLLCPHDWSKKLKVGNLKQDSILNLWQSKSLEFARKKLSIADRNFLPCRNCSVNGTLMGQEHFEQWINR